MVLCCITNSRWNQEEDGWADDDTLRDWDGRYDSEPEDDTMLSAEEYAAKLGRLGSLRRLFVVLFVLASRFPIFSLLAPLLFCFLFLLVWCFVHHINSR